MSPALDQRQVRHRALGSTSSMHLAGTDDALSDAALGQAHTGRAMCREDTDTIQSMEQKQEASGAAVGD